jgi:DNA-binding beta-propeller fold protein YncE
MNMLMRPRSALLALLSLAALPLAGVEILPATGADKLGEPFSVDFDAQGKLYGVEFTPSNQVFEVRDGQIHAIAGVRWNSTAKGAQPPAPAKAKDLSPAVFNGLHDIAVAPDGSLYVADTFQNRIVRIDPKTHAATAFAGTGEAGFAGDGGPATQAKFNNPFCCSLSPDGKSMVIADLGNARVRRIDLATNRIETIAGNGKRGIAEAGSPALTAPLNGPRATCVAKDGTVYIVQREGNSLVALKDGKLKTVVNIAGKKGNAGDNGPAAEAQLNGPKYICMDAKGRVLILDTENHAIRAYDPTKQTLETVVGTLGKAGAKIAPDWAGTQLKRPHGARIGPDGRLYVTDSENSRILVGTAP